MATTYTWNVSTVDTHPSKTDSNAITRVDVIHNVHWRLLATEKTDGGDTYTAESYGSQQLDISNLSSFTAFTDVKLSNVQSWVETAIGTDEVASLKASLDGRITEQQTPTSVQKIIEA